MRRGPLIAAVGAMVLAIGAVVFLNARKAPVAEIISNAPNLFGVPRHPIKPEMVSKAEKTTGSVLDDIELDDSLGVPTRLSDLYKDKPLLIIGVKDGCPCNIESQHWFNTLYSHYGDKINFVGVMDAHDKAGEIFRQGTEQKYTMLVSPNGDQVFRTLNTLQSVYVTLVDTKGKVIKQWPGYDQTRLKEMNALLAKTSGLEEVKWDVSTAPTKPTSGCFFFEPVGSDPTMNTP